MRKSLFFVVLLAGCVAMAFPQAQRRPVLGILPFTGGAGGDGEAIATLISIEPEILRAFTVVPRTAALDDIFAEHYFQLAGLTDSDTIAGIGRMLNADYVLSGTIRRLGDRNLVIATVVNVESFEQVAGYHRTYGTIEEVVGFIPSMSRSIIHATLERDTARLPSLAMLPFTMAPGIDAQDAETLSKILAIEILNTGGYVILPRTSTIQAALADEIGFQLMGYTDDEGIVALGRAINADFVLSGGVHRLGALNLFTVQVLHVRDGSVLVGASRNYQVIADGVDLMAELALELMGVEIRVGRGRRPPRAPRAPRDDDGSARFNTLGVSLGTSFAEPAAIVILQGTWAPGRHTFFRVGMDLGFGSGVDDVGYFSLCGYAHFAVFVPFAERGGWHIGSGFGFMRESYDFGGFSIDRTMGVMDFVTGFNFGDVFGLSYTLRTNFSTALHQIAAGFTLRFRN